MIVVCGEALFDLFPVAATPTGMTLDACVGGSPFNVALGLARLGQPVSFLGGVSTGPLGERLMQALAAEGIGDGLVQRVDAPTTLSFVGLDARGVPSYSFYGEHAADRRLQSMSNDLLPPGTRAIHVGSYAMVVEPVAGALRHVVERWHGRTLVAYDPNVRLNVEPSLDRWRDAIRWMLPRADVLKISDEDLGLLYPGVGADDLAAQWRAKGAAAVVVTRGGRGVKAFVRDTVVDMAAVPVQAVDTVGAGDSFQAAMLAALAERDALSPTAIRSLPADDWAAVLAMASRAAALTCSRRGADLPRRAELG